ncbi:hypothetical protein Y032_0032g2508 [Ancylostoma ceylanicum]|nr:hypothetical protein Y032_0032g2508 [Ancylostoma ceylanicum]
MYTPLMYYSQLFICVSVTLITYGCSRRRVEESGKFESTKKEVVAVTSNSTSETRDNIIEITAKSDRAEWFSQEPRKPSPQERRKPSSNEHHKPVGKHDDSKDPHHPKSLSLDSLKQDFKPTSEGGPDGKRAEPLAQVKNVPTKTGTRKFEIFSAILKFQCLNCTQLTAPHVAQKHDTGNSRNLAKMSVDLKKTQEYNWDKAQKGRKKHVFVLEPISFLNSANKEEEQKKVPQDDETINDAPSLVRVNISKDSEELQSYQGQVKAKGEVPKDLPTAREVSFDESLLYPLQKTMGSQRLEANEGLALDKTPYPSSEARANQ